MRRLIISVLAICVVFSCGKKENTFFFRDQEYNISQADSLRQACRAELATLDSIRAFVEEENRKLDSIFAPFPDHSWYLAKKREGVAFIRRADSLAVVVRAEMEELSNLNMKGPK